MRKKEGARSRSPHAATRNAENPHAKMCVTKRTENAPIPAASSHCAWGGRLCLHPVQFGISHRAIARQQNPKFESIPPVALRQCGEPPLAFYVADKMLRASDSTCLTAGEGLSKIAICVRARSVRAKSRFKWQRSLTAAPRVVETQRVQSLTAPIRDERGD